MESLASRRALIWSLLGSFERAAWSKILDISDEPTGIARGV